MDLHHAKSGTKHIKVLTGSVVGASVLIMAAIVYLLIMCGRKNKNLKKGQYVDVYDLSFLDNIC